MLSLKFSPEVAQARQQNQPIVSMESTLITHGLPYPDNLQAAQQMEAIVRQAGAVPATVAIIQGDVCVGLTEAQLDYLAKAQNVMRCSRRNLPLAIAQKMDGSTTVAGTMVVSALAGIELFATGGIGGVHRGHPFDVSADLTELGQTAVTVVCGGPKPFLDLANTREVLETNGVAVIGYQTDDFAPFFKQHTGHYTDLKADSTTEIAQIIEARRALQLQSGTLVTVPAPSANRFDYELIETAISQATHDADAQGISGPAVTNWMIRALVQTLGADIIKANISLLCENARVAAEIATSL